MYKILKKPLNPRFKMPPEVRSFIVDQVRGRQKAKEKFPFLLEKKNLVYPPGISIEQASSQHTARFKAQLFSGNSFIDLTCGMGIDALFMAESFRSGWLVESNERLAAITSHNLLATCPRLTVVIGHRDNHRSGLSLRRATAAGHAWAVAGATTGTALVHRGNSLLVLCRSIAAAAEQYQKGLVRFERTPDIDGYPAG